MSDKWPVFVGTWKYQSFLVLPTAAEIAALPGSPVSSKKWAMGTLDVGDNVGLTVVNRVLTFQPGVELVVALEFKDIGPNEPFSMTGVGIGESGPLKGARYELTGWGLVDKNNPTSVISVQGTIRAARGTDAKPEVDPGGMPIPVVGFFALTQ